MERHGIRNIRVIHARWPMDAADDRGFRATTRQRRAPTSRSSPTSATTSRRSGPSSTRWRRPRGRLCVAVMSERVPSAPAGPFWPPVHGEPRVELPAFGEFLAILRARGTRPGGQLRAAPGARLRVAGCPARLAAQPALRRDRLGGRRAAPGRARAAQRRGGGRERPPRPGDRVEGRRRPLGAATLNPAAPVAAPRRCTGRQVPSGTTTGPSGTSSMCQMAAFLRHSRRMCRHWSATKADPCRTRSPRASRRPGVPMHVTRREGEVPR